jgi:chromosome segregation ATPase
MGRWKKLQFWRRRDVKADIQGRERDAQLERLEATFRDRETHLVKKLEVQRQAEATLRGRVSDLDIKLKVQKQLEATLRDRVSDLENELKEQKQVEATLRARISEMEEKRELRRQCEKLRVGLAKAQFQKEIANIRITDLENKVQEKDLERKNVEAYQNCVINELCVRIRKSNRNRTEEAAAFQGRIKKLKQKLKDTNNEKKEEEPAPPGKMKKLVALAVTMVVGGVVVGGTYINYGVNLG